MADGDRGSGYGAPPESAVVAGAFDACRRRMALPPAGFPIGVFDGHRRSRHAFIVLIALGVISGGTISSQNNTDCASAYRSYLEELKHKDITPQRRAAVQRWALRIYDACETGDLEDDAKRLFERLDRKHY